MGQTLLSLPKKAWLWLTKMKTALVLLFLLALAAIPGALLPQRNVNETKVAQYIDANGQTAQVFDRLGLFDVFSSTWFAAIYILLFVSLIGCIIPRSWDHYQALRSHPPIAPRRLERMPHSVSGPLPDATIADAQSRIRARFARWNTVEASGTEDRAGHPEGWSLAAERGYLREAANLVFHLSLVGLLLAVAIGRMTYYEGQVIVVADGPNSQFCNSAVSGFDSFRHGSLVDGTGLNPYCVNIRDFKADYLDNGQAVGFESNIDYASGEDAFLPVEEWNHHLLKVNHPLRLNGDRVYLQGHGYAPTFTITWPNGETRTETVQFRPDDLTFFLSSGAVRWDPPAGMYPDLYERRQNQISLQGLFAPSAEFTGEKGTLLSSNYPALRDPAVAIDIYRGDTGIDAGKSQNIFSLDSAAMHNGSLQKLARVNLKEGESVTLDNGTKISFDGAKEFVNLQISHDPTTLWVLGFAALMLISLVGSLMVKRRRIWVRILPDAAPASDTSQSPRYVMQVAGLSRTDSAGWAKEFERTAEDLLGLEEEALDDEHATSAVEWSERFDDGLDDSLRR